MLGILTVEAAMPTATAATMLSLQYGGNDKLASEGVFLTTLFSVVTIPLLLFLLLS
jgi:predicted permease